MKRKTKAKIQEAGITLVALVVTIVVLLILVAITINMVLGNNGVIQKAEDASEKNMEALIKEEISMAWSGVEMDGLTNDWDINQKAVKLSQDLSEGSVSVDGKIVKVSNYKGYNADVNSETGVVVVSKGEVIINVDFETIKAEAKANRQGSEAIGISATGNIIDNMSNWYYVSSGQGELALGNSEYLGSTDYAYYPGYRGPIINGKIVGEIPQYILPEGEEEFFTVTNVDWAFYNLSELLYGPVIPATVTNIGSSIFTGCDNLISVSVDPANPKYDSRNNCNAIIETETNKLIRGLKTTIIPNTVTEIGNFAFNGCDFATIVIPNSITQIGYNAFGGSSLEEIVIPSSVQEIGRYAFQYCRSLQSITISNGVREIGEYAFYYCDALESITIPGSVETVGKKAFLGLANLRNVNIEDGVNKTIEESCFALCENLVSVSLAGTVRAEERCV